jgi:hypothetical protein
VKRQGQVRILTFVRASRFQTAHGSFPIEWDEERKIIDWLLKEEAVEEALEILRAREDHRRVVFAHEQKAILLRAIRAWVESGEPPAPSTEMLRVRECSRARHRTLRGGWAVSRRLGRFPRPGPGLRLRLESVVDRTLFRPWPEASSTRPGSGRRRPPAGVFSSRIEVDLREKGYVLAASVKAR